MLQNYPIADSVGGIETVVAVSNGGQMVVRLPVGYSLAGSNILGAVASLRREFENRSFVVAVGTGLVEKVEHE